MADIADTDRVLLYRLMRTAKDGALVPAVPEELHLDAPVEWSEGYEDPAHDVHITVVFIRDPHQRSTEARRLRTEAEAVPGSVVLVGMNGGMLLFGRTPGADVDDDTPGVERLRNLATRFAGRE